ncbi:MULTISPECIES: hypothetical protein [unclassified Nocardioides]|uniref:hypothetical protein n=1 Tax=unclassified Nocardioides TaxID=2615069 RepID=UPI0006F957CB|nr:MULTISPECIES: hypothetical protein [unclassified Nocardioides]KRA37409.1 hypothetical protein ASD81_01365 [Nocardioides sp. Root614]KRA91370.1 hypothetical protein ASD84_01630 [Nocardioides sp. Root682]
MSDEHENKHEIGSVGEEAMKLFGALADAARQQAGEAAGSATGFAAQAAAMAHEVNEHIATGEAECRYCPVCRVVHAVRQTSPEVRTHLMVAASSLLQAAAGFMETLPPPPGADGAHQRGAGVEHIDLDDTDDAGDPTDGPGRTP